MQKGRLFFLLIVCLFPFAENVFAEAGIGTLTDPARLTEKEIRDEKEADENFEKACHLYLAQAEKRDRQEALALWRKIATLSPSESRPNLNYLILLSSLNTGFFKNAREALICLGLLDPQAKGFQPETLKTLDWNKSPAVVRIVERLSDNSVRARGSGTIISKDGWILTCAHVITNIDNPAVQFCDGTFTIIDLIYPGDFQSDLALVKVNGNFSFETSFSPDQPLPGDSIYSISFPKGCHVPVLAEGVYGDPFEHHGYGLNNTSLSALPGSSGGGVFNQRGELVGVMSGLSIDSGNQLSKGFASVPHFDSFKKFSSSWRGAKAYPTAEKSRWITNSVFWEKSDNEKDDLYFRGVAEIQDNPNKAILLLKESFKKGYIRAGLTLGILLWNNNREKEAFEYFSASSDLMPISQAYRGMFKMRGIGTLKDVDAGIKDLEKASQRGSSFADAYLAFCYFTGAGVKPDLSKANQYAEKASKNGGREGSALKLFALFIDLMPLKNDQSVDSIGSQIQDFSVNDIPEEKAARFFEYLRIASDKTVPFANILSGFAYFYGIGTRQDMDKAMSFFEKAALEGDEASALRVASFYFESPTRNRDLDKCMYWSEMAALRGNNQAKLFFACSDLLKKEKNKEHQLHSSSLIYLADSADSGILGAQFLLGRLYFEGKYLPKDPTKAFYYFDKAAKAGSVEAQAYLPIARAELEKAK